MVNGLDEEGHGGYAEEEERGSRGDGIAAADGQEDLERREIRRPTGV